MSQCVQLVAPIKNGQKKELNQIKGEKSSCVMCYMSHATCRVSPDTCNLSLTTTDTATHPTPANSSVKHSGLV